MITKCSTCYKQPVRIITILVYKVEMKMFSFFQSTVRLILSRHVLPSSNQLFLPWTICKYRLFHSTFRQYKLLEVEWIRVPSIWFKPHNWWVVLIIIQLNSPQRTQNFYSYFVACQFNLFIVPFTGLITGCCGIGNYRIINHF